jgi:5-methylcytosine-specific restriction enzyme subunit McrC
MRIPIQNIYYLLCYAWNKLDEKDRIKVGIEDTTELVDLFAKVLINATKVLLKRGVDKNYIEHIEEVAGVKGKLLISQSIKHNILFKQRTICNFDDFSSNILSNQILLATISRLTRTKGIDYQLKYELVSLQKMFIDIDHIQMSSSLFKQVRLNRNNRFYGFAMDVCKIIFESSFPSEEKGKFLFSDFTRDERKMPYLFEEFIRNFYKIEQVKFTTVKRDNIEWKFESLDELNDQYLPQMQTDITLENLTDKVIIDAKYSQETMVLNYNKEKIKSGNLYQLFSYLINQEKDTDKSQKAIGILLYPTIDKEYDLNFKYDKHEIKIRTLNLNTDWKNIHERLLAII